MSKLMSVSRPRNSKFSHKYATYGTGSQDNRIVRATIHGISQLSSNAIGTLATAISMDPNTFASTDWADFSAAYDEFRVIGVEIEMVSLLQNSVTASNNVLITFYDNDSTTTASSYTQALQYGTSKTSSAIFQHSGGKTLKYTFWRPTAGSETNIPWIDVAASSGSAGSIGVYAESLNNSTAYIGYTVRCFCEFRGRR